MKFQNLSSQVVRNKFIEKRKKRGETKKRAGEKKEKRKREGSGFRGEEERGY